jgi:VCBS repeat-containing protein
VNDLPVAGDDTAKTLEDTPTVIDVLGNDSDIDLSDVLMVTALADPANGIVATNGISLTYTPTLNFNGLDVFTYTVGDGNGGGAMATVTVTVNAVNDPPVAVDDGFVTDENTAFVTGNVLENDYDPDNETVSFAGLSTTGTAGLVTSNGDGTFDYDPNGQFDYLAVGETAVDTFGYTISDTQNLTATAIVSITIEGVNDLPVAGDDTAETLEDTATVIDALGNDMDIDSSDVLMVTAVANPTNGIVATNGISITYTPTLNFNGLDVFTYTVGDGNGGFDTATVTVTVEAVNDPPVAGDDLALTRAGVAVLVDVLSNDDDPVDGDMLVITAVDDPLNGTAVIVGSEILYTPDANFVGLEQFTYTISDGEYFVTATITVTVEPHLWYFAVVIKS